MKKFFFLEIDTLQNQDTCRPYYSYLDPMKESGINLYKTRWLKVRKPIKINN